MRSPPRRFRTALVAAAAAAVVSAALPGAAIGFEGAQGARELYDRAQRAEAELRRSPSQQRNRSAWTRVADAYRAVVVAWPRSGYCDDALYQEGGLYRDAAERFGTRSLAARSANSYAQLARGYPTSKWVPKALYEQVRLFHGPLGDPASARRAARRLAEHDPRGTELRLAEALLDPPEPEPETPRAARPTPRRVGTAAAEPVEVRGIRHWVGQSHTRVVIDLSGPADHIEGRLEGPPRVFFDFPGASLAEELRKDFPIAGSHLQKIRLGPHADKARVVLDFSSVREVTVFELPDPYRLVVDIHGAPPPRAADAGARAPAAGTDEGEAPAVPEPTGTGYSLARQLGAGVRRVVIDAGHGGHDPGTRSGSLREKDIVLDISRRVRDDLEARGFEVVMTRDRDEFIPLEQRAFIANNAGSDIFVSIHANAARNRSARGLETYYLNLATSPEAAEVAARENASASGIRMSDMPKLLSQILNHNRVEESRELAGTMQAALAERMLGSRRHRLNRGVKTAGFHVLLGAQMAAILVEVGFVSNAAEAKQLRTDAYRDRLAASISEGIARYAASLGDPAQTTADGSSGRR